MKNLTVTKKIDGDFEGRKAEDSDYDVLLDEDATLTREDGSLLCVLLKRHLSRENTASAWSVLKDAHMWTFNRGVASGEEIVYKNKSRITENPVDSGIIGFFERTSRLPYCRVCAWNLHNPEKWEAVVPLVKEVDGLFSKFAPERYERQKAVAQKTHSDFLIPGTFFSTLTVNQNFRTSYHRDAGNLSDGISCMSVIRQGKWTGANLVFPDYRVAVKLDSFDLIIFDPHELHGNTRLVKMSPDAVRCSIVYYFREKIQYCGSAAEELETVKNRKQGEQMFKTILRKKES